jgi:hypothetical protein
LTAASRSTAPVTRTRSRVGIPRSARMATEGLEPDAPRHCKKRSSSPTNAVLEYYLEPKLRANRTDPATLAIAKRPPAGDIRTAFRLLLACGLLSCWASKACAGKTRPGLIGQVTGCVHGTVWSHVRSEVHRVNGSSLLRGTTLARSDSAPPSTRCPNLAPSGAETLRNVPQGGR